MKKKFGSFLMILALVASSGCATIRPTTPRHVGLAITNTTVIDPESGRVLPHRSVFIDGDTIVAIEPASGSNFLASRVVDGSGKFLVPGFTDMHVHLFLPEPAGPTLNLLLANGVTSIREMSSDCWANAGAKSGCIDEYRRLQAAISAGATVGPEILGTTSSMVFGPSRMKLRDGAPQYITPQDANQALALVSYLATRGVDLIKTHDSIPLASFTALMAEADRRRIPVGGHVPFAAGSLDAAKMGYRSIEHARDLLYDCSRYGPDFRRREAAFAEGVPKSERPTNVDRLRRTVDEFDPTLCARLLQNVASTSVYYVPTHVTREMEARARDLEYRDDPARKYILPKRNENWETDLAETAELPDAETSALRDFFEHGLRITGLAYLAGIPVMAGTDTNDTMIVPGFSLHRELGLLRSAGLPAMAVLRAATTVPAAYFGRSDRLGGVSPGKEADLVLLEQNPLDDIANTRGIAAVVHNGRLLDRAALDALLAETEALAQSPRP